MAGVGGKLHSLLLLLLSMALLLGLSAVTDAEQLGRAVGAGKEWERCCSCGCDKRAPELSMCVCGGEWEGGCPSVCSECRCDCDDVCTCADGRSIKYYDCQRDACNPFGASGSVLEGMVM